MWSMQSLFFNFSLEGKIKIGSLTFPNKPLLSRRVHVELAQTLSNKMLILRRKHSPLFNPL